MQAFKTIVPAQQLAALALAAAVTVLMLFSVGAQADAQHADALASAKQGSQQLSAAPQRAARS